MIGIGIVGCGAIAAERHVPEFSNNSKCHIVGYFNPSRENARKLAAQYGGVVFDSYEALLACKEIDAVCICAPNKFHCDMTVQAFYAGKHVLCEKPIAVSVEEAKRMIQAANETDKTFMTAHDMKYDQVNVKAKEILESKRLGKVLTFQTSFGHRGLEYWSVDSSLHSWFFRKEGLLSGVLGDLGIHKAHLIAWLLDDDVAEVSAMSATRHKKNESGEAVPVDDNCVSLLRMKNGAIGTLTSSWTYYGKMDMSTTIHCANGTIEIYNSDKYPLILRERNGEQTCYSFPENKHSRVADKFIECIESGESPEVETCEGLKALQVIEACIKSQTSHQIVKVYV